MKSRSSKGNKGDQEQWEALPAVGDRPTAAKALGPKHSAQAESNLRAGGSLWGPPSGTRVGSGSRGGTSDRPAT